MASDKRVVAGLLDGEGEDEDENKDGVFGVFEKSMAEGGIQGTGPFISSARDGTLRPSAVFALELELALALMLCGVMPSPVEIAEDMATRRFSAFMACWACSWATWDRRLSVDISGRDLSVPASCWPCGSSCPLPCRCASAGGGAVPCACPFSSRWMAS